MNTTVSVLTVNRFKTCVNEKKFEILTGHKIFYFQNAYLDIEYNKFEQTYGDREHFCDASQLKIRRINGTKDRGIFGPLIFHGPIDDSFEIQLTMYKKQGGEYRLLPMKIPPNAFCKAVNNDPHYIHGFVKGSNMTLPMPCPLINVFK